MTTQHSIIELSIPYSVFGFDTTITSVYWSPACGNDVLVVNDNVQIPAPGAAVLATLGMPIVGWVRRRWS